jgi:hypothetical protein
MEKISSECFETGYVETLSGRRRYIPLIKSSRRQEVEAAKRIAINSPIQGTSADLIKKAMLDIHTKIKKSKFKSRMILQVHDELVFEVHTSEKEKIYNLAKKSMEEVIELSKKLNYTSRGIYFSSYYLKHKPKLYNFDEKMIVDVKKKVKDITEFKSLNQNSEIQITSNFIITSNIPVLKMNEMEENNQIHESGIIVIALDKSTSMGGSKWRNANKGTQSLIEYVRKHHSDP